MPPNVSYLQQNFPMVQVFFMEDRLDPQWKVVIRHDPRSRRRIDEEEYLVFGAGESDLVAPTSVQRMPTNFIAEGDEIEALQVRAVDSRALEEDNKEHFVDMKNNNEEDDD